MDAKRRLLIVAIVLLVAGLLITTAWSVMSDIEPAPVIVPGGVYTAVHLPPTEFSITQIVHPLDPAGNTMTFIFSNDGQDPTFGQTEPPVSEVDHLTDLVGNMVRTGPTTWAYTGVGYGRKKVEGQGMPELVYIIVVKGWVEYTDDGNISRPVEGRGNSFAAYWPEQDADGDGFPDEDQEPWYCGPGAPATEMTRIPVTPPCVFTPLPGDE